MGKLSQQRRSRTRMTLFNSSKANQVLKLEVENALKEQTNQLNVKHKAIVQFHSEKLKEKYKENFTTAINFYKSEIESLTKKLETEKSSRLTSHFKRPVYSTGRYFREEAEDYSTNGSSKTVTPDQTQPTCCCELVCICKPANLSRKEPENG